MAALSIMAAAVGASGPHGVPARWLRVDVEVFGLWGQGPVLSEPPREPHRLLSHSGRWDDIRRSCVRAGALEFLVVVIEASGYCGLPRLWLGCVGEALGVWSLRSKGWGFGVLFRSQKTFWGILHVWLFWIG